MFHYLLRRIVSNLLKCILCYVLLRRQVYIINHQPRTLSSPTPQIKHYPPDRKAPNSNASIPFDTNSSSATDVNHHEKVIKPGFRATGNRIWHAHSIARGKIATNWVIFQLQGMNVPSAITSIAAMANTLKAMEYLNVLATLGIWMKKLENSTSFAVAPHDMLILSMWHISAWEMWRDIPPKKTMNIVHHLKFSMTATQNGG